MIPGYATVLAASVNDRRDLFVEQATGSARSSKTSKRIFGFAGRWMLYSMGCKPEARGCCSKGELRFPRLTD
jgi:hypothetical protein